MDTAYLNTPVGLLKIQADENYIHSIQFYKGNNKACKQISNPHIKKLKCQLLEYFKRKRTNFDVPYQLKGTDFQVKVWKSLINVPYSQTTSYSNLAKKIGHAKAIRAVGSACGKNQLPIVIPCHRVLNTNGQLGGFAGGLKLKQSLLDLEK